VRDIPELVEGYRSFLAGRYAEQATLYRRLAERGQSPKTMVIACCDSRADPALIFDAPPGGLFVLRNIANLVPPYEPDSAHHGTSAALEFAVTVIEVENILVMGHGQCGGIAAFLDKDRRPASPGDFIGRWMALLDDSQTESARADDTTPADRRQAAEFAAVRHSLASLMGFPFIRRRVEAGKLRLRGAWFEIASGRLLAMDPDSGEFGPVT
jgi:carbonic anhydrase